MMLKIKFIMAALLALSFTTGGYADGDIAVAPSKMHKPAHGGMAKGKKLTPGWSEKGEALKKKCNKQCTKNGCMKSPVAAECARNCRKDFPFELIDCTPGAYAAKCGAYAKENAGADASGVKGAKINSRKEDGTCLLLAKANAAIMNAVYLGRDNKSSKLGGGKMTAEEAQDKANFSREAKIWRSLKSLDADNDEANVEASFAAAPAQEAVS